MSTVGALVLAMPQAASQSGLRPLVRIKVPIGGRMTFEYTSSLLPIRSFMRPAALRQQPSFNN